MAGVGTVQVRTLYLVFTLVAEPGPLGTPGQGRGKGSRHPYTCHRLGSRKAECLEASALQTPLHAGTLQDPLVKGKLLGYRLQFALVE